MRAPFRRNCHSPTICHLSPMGLPPQLPLPHCSRIDGQAGERGGGSLCRVALEIRLIEMWIYNMHFSAFHGIIRAANIPCPAWSMTPGEEATPQSHCLFIGTRAPSAWPLLQSSLPLETDAAGPLIQPFCILPVCWFQLFMRVWRWWLVVESSSRLRYPTRTPLPPLSCTTVGKIIAGCIYPSAVALETIKHGVRVVGVTLHAAPPPSRLRMFLSCCVFGLGGEGRGIR